MAKPKAVMNWSGGKDSAFALYRILQSDKLDVRFLLTTVSEKWQRISMHGVRRELLRKQAETIGIELIEIFLPEVASIEAYDEKMNEAMDFLIEQEITHSIFGDIFLADLRQYREERLAQKGLQGVFPLWGISTRNLIEEFLQAGFKAITVCVDASKLDRNFCGRILDLNFVEELPLEVDPCGENGEFHTFVFEGPYFRSPILIEKGEIIYREYSSTRWSNRFYYCDLFLAETKDTSF